MPRRAAQCSAAVRSLPVERSKLLGDARDLMGTIGDGLDGQPGGGGSGTGVAGQGRGV